MPVVIPHKLVLEQKGLGRSRAEPSQHRSVLLQAVVLGSSGLMFVDAGLTCRRLGKVLAQQRFAVTF